MACFTCGKSFNNTEIGILNRYKEYSIKTKKSFWFFKDNNNDLKIMSNEDFKTYQKNNRKLFKANKIEFANIQEFK